MTSNEYGPPVENVKRPEVWEQSSYMYAEALLPSLRTDFFPAFIIKSKTSYQKILNLFCEFILHVFLN